MDKLIYTAMSGANVLSQRQDSVANNLANASTTGFRSELNSFVAMPLGDSGSTTRVSAVETTSGTNFTPGDLRATGNALDAAINGAGFFAVQGADGTEAYTRNGQFQIGADGTLQTNSGLPVVGDGGPLSVPPDQQVSIGRDGSVSAISLAGGRKTVIPIGKLKLVNPDTATLARSPDGLFHTVGGSPAPSDPGVVVAPEHVEGSNVNPIESMITMIELARQFETNTKLMTTADENANKADQLLSITN